MTAEEQIPCLAIPVRDGGEQPVAIALYGPHESGSDISPDECEMLRAQVAALRVAARAKASLGLPP